MRFRSWFMLTAGLVLVCGVRTWAADPAPKPAPKADKKPEAKADDKAADKTAGKADDDKATTNPDEYLKGRGLKLVRQVGF